MSTVEDALAVPANPGRIVVDGLVNGVPCDEWPKARNADGYGWQWHNGKVKRAHRVAWEEAHGPIPDGLSVLHHCDNPPCREVRHLYLGTQQDNVRDREDRQRRPPPVGLLNGRAKLTPADVTALRRSWSAGGVTMAELGRRFGIGTSQVRRVLLGHEWTELPVLPPPSGPSPRQARCKRDHPLDGPEADVRLDRRGARHCRKCERMRRGKGATR